MPFCTNCGREIKVGRFCPGCGAAIIAAPEASVDAPATPAQEPAPAQEAVFTASQETPVPAQEVHAQAPDVPPADMLGGYQPPVYPRPAPPQPESPKKKKLTFILLAAAVLLVAAVVVVLLWPGSGSPAGTYEITSMSADGMTLDADLLTAFGYNIVLVLREDGNGEISVLGTYSTPLTWKDGTIFTEGESIAFSVDGDSLVLYGEDGERAQFTRTGDASEPEETLGAADAFADLFITEEIQTPQTEESTQFSWGTGTVLPEDDEPAGEQPSAFWDNSFYGWWVINDASGLYATWEGSWWDCCAVTTTSGEAVSLSVWDEDGNASNALMLSADLYCDASGALKLISGDFWDCALPDSFCLLPGAQTGFPYDGLYITEGYYSDPNLDDSSFSYTIYLRPWGALWDDWSATESSCLPYYYEDWYLPLLEAGYASAPTDLKIGELP